MKILGRLKQRPWGSTMKAMSSIRPVSDAAVSELRHKIDNKTKPLGSLGRLESLALQIGRIQNTASPRLDRPVLMVFAADHGVVSEGVSPYPQAVTRQMVLNFLAGGAAVNVFCGQSKFELRIIDAGVNHDFPCHPALIDAKIARGTANFLRQPAMTGIQCETALERGAALAQREVDQGSNVFAFGEMGIGNTSSASALMSVLLRLPLDMCVGRGTGLDDSGIKRKRAIIEKSIAAHSVDNDPMTALRTFGGFEIAMLAGAMLAAASASSILLIDGFIVTVALLVASRLDPHILDYCVFAHQSGELGHEHLLRHFGVEPLLTLDMRLGEGTGAALAYPLLVAAVNFLNDMASFDTAGVSRKESVDDSREPLSSPGAPQTAAST